MTDQNTKICKSCNQEQPLSAFYQKQRDDYAHECWDCRQASATGLPVITSHLSREVALFEVTLLNAKTSDLIFDDVVVDGIGGGIPIEVLTRMKDLWESTKEIGGEIVAIGKIIIIQIIDFLKANPKLVASLAIGASVYLLSNAIPFIGPYLAPLLAVVSTLYSFGTMSTLDETINTAKNFFQLLVAVFNAVACR